MLAGYQHRWARSVVDRGTGQSVPRWDTRNAWVLLKRDFEQILFSLIRDLWFADQFDGLHQRAGS